MLLSGIALAATCPQQCKWLSVLHMDSCRYLVELVSVHRSDATVLLAASVGQWLYSTRYTAAISAIRSGRTHGSVYSEYSAGGWVCSFGICHSRCFHRKYCRVLCLLLCATVLKLYIIVTTTSSDYPGGIS